VWSRLTFGIGVSGLLGIEVMSTTGSLEDMVVMSVKPASSGLTGWIPVPGAMTNDWEFREYFGSFPCSCLSGVSQVAVLNARS
jgi:hypothetical protein